MYLRQSLRRLIFRKGSWTRDTGLPVRLGGSTAHLSLRLRRFSDNQAHKMSKKALILIADGTEEMEL